MRAHECQSLSDLLYPPQTTAIVVMRSSLTSARKAPGVFVAELLDFVWYYKRRNGSRMSWVFSVK